MQEGRSVMVAMRTPAEALSAEYSKLNTLLAVGAISQETYTRAIIKAQDAFEDTWESTKRLREESERLNAMIAATPSAQLEKTRSDMELLANAFMRGAEGVQTYDQYIEAVQTRLGMLPENTERAASALDEFAVGAARNMQSAFADFLFNPFDDGIKGMLRGFVTAVHRMASEALAAQLALKLFGDFGNTGRIGGGVGSLFSAIFGGARADGGPVTVGQTYLVGERGPELFTPNTSGSILPNESLAQHNQSTAPNIRIVNAFDSSVIGDYMGSDAGEQIVMNAVRRNQAAIRQLAVAG